MGSSMAANIVREINSCRSFVRGREALIGTIDQSIQANLATTIIKMINSASSFGPAEAGHVQDALKDNPFGDTA